MRQGVGEEYADAINLGREQGSVDVFRDTSARLGSVGLYHTVRDARGRGRAPSRHPFA